jgi:NAD+ kinase
MAKPIRNVAIITKINSIQAEKAASKLTKLLTSRKVNVYSMLPLVIDNSKSVSSQDLRNIELDLVFAVGGDGTTLRALRIIHYETPLFSMNVGGNRGILSEVGVDSIDDAVNALLAGQYFSDSRLRIQASINGKIIPPALNDILFIRINLTRTPVLSIKLMNDEIKQRMDGIIISTPTGSTGHSFSNGGPILHERLNCLILSPIACVNRMPELVIPTEEIKIKSNHDAELVLDGQETFKVTEGQTVKISRFSVDAQFIRLKRKGMRQLAKLGF